MRPIDLLRQRIQTPGSPMSARTSSSTADTRSTTPADTPPTAPADRPTDVPSAPQSADDNPQSASLSVDYIPQPVPYDAPTQPTGPTAGDAGAGYASTSSATSMGDDAILPTALDDDALRDAVGAPSARPKRKRRGDDDGDDGIVKPAGRRTLVIVAVALLVGLAIAGLALLGRVNAQRYVIACTTDQVSAEQGRSFPPWGTKPLVGAEWKPITLPPSAECNPRETDNRADLEGWFLQLLVDRASTTLTSRNLLDAIQPGKTNPLDVVADQLNQALLLSRAPERRDQRKEVERLLGDVAYWRASLRLRDAAAALADAARQFEGAAVQRPRHVTDAAQWSAFLRGMVDSLHAGPNGQLGAVPSSEPSAEHPTAPVGTAMPVEPVQPSTEQPPTPDAGLPTGGVLL
jgi:hypothetical protein